MTAAADDLDYNPFYQALQNEYNSEYQEALDKCFTLCIPETMSLEEIHFNKEFVEIHILKPSPFFQGEFMTTDPLNSFTLQLEDNVLTTSEGFEYKRTIKVLADEVGYNKDNNTYRILLIEEPIHIPGAKNGKPPSTVRKKAIVEPLTPKITFLENKNFLLSLQDSYKMLTYLDEKVHHFNDNYLLLKKYLHDASSRLKNTWDDATLYVNELCKESFKEDPRFKDNVSLAVESYVVGKTYDKLYPVICEHCLKEDEELLQRLIQLQDISGDRLSLRPEFCCPLPAAVVEVANLDGLATPIEKMACMKSILDSISEGVNAHLLASLTVDDPPCLTSDDLIPLLIIVIVQSKSPHLTSNLYFIEHFHWASSSKDDLSFSFVTFKAAVSYLQTVDITQILPKTSIGLPKQHDPAASKTGSGSWVEQKPEGGKRKGSRFDRQMDRITKMLEISTNELAGTSFQAPSARPVIQRPSNVIGRQGNKPQLGSFLSSLKDDSAHSSWESSLDMRYSALLAFYQFVVYYIARIKTELGLSEDERSFSSALSRDH